MFVWARRFFISLMATSLVIQNGLAVSYGSTDDPEKTKVASPNDQWAELEPISGKANTALSPAFPDKKWWLKFNDHHLDGYINEAVTYNPGLKASAERIQQARAMVAQSVSRQLPSISFNPGFNRFGLPGLDLGGPLGGSLLSNAIKFFMLSFQASYELDLFGKNLDRTKSAKKDQEAAELDTKAMLISLEGEVASAYFNLIRADALINLQQENLKHLKRIHELRNSQRQAGLIPLDDVIRVERELSQGQTNLTVFKQQQALFAHQLAVLLGRPPEKESNLERGSIFEVNLPLETETGIPSELVARRPDILASERRLEKAYIDVRVARKEFLPSINLSGMLGLGGSEFKDMFDWDNRSDMQSVGIRQPIFQGGGLRAGLKLRQAQQREQIENYRQTILTAFREVEDQLTLLRANYENLNNSTKRQELTEKNVSINQSRFKQGLIPRLELLQAESELLQYRQLSTQSKADAVIATVNLYKALGGGF